MNIDTTVIRAGMADLIAVAFYRVGYRPRQCLVAVGLTGPGHRVGVVCRIDLPVARRRRADVESVLRLLRREGHDHLVALIVSDSPLPSTAAGPVRLAHRPLARELCKQGPKYGLQILDTIAVGASHWRSYHCVDTSCCPTEGHSLQTALTGPAATRLIAEGQVLACDEADLVADVTPPMNGESPMSAESPMNGESPMSAESPMNGESPMSAESQGSRASAFTVGGAEPGGSLVDAAAALERWRALLAEPSAESATELDWLVEALEDRWLRDAVLLTLIPGSGTAADEVLAGGDPATMEAAFEADPDEELLERGRVLLSAVVRSAPVGRRADALALLAWAAWWSGKGARGRLLAERALADSPGHRLARLVDQLLLLGVAPAWVMRLRNGRGSPISRS